MNGINELFININHEIEKNVDDTVNAHNIEIGKLLLKIEVASYSSLLIS